MLHTHIDYTTSVLPILHVGPDNSAQTLDSRDERHCKMTQELMRVGRGEHKSSNLAIIISVFLWKLFHNFMDRKEAAYFPPRWLALQKFKEAQKDCRRTLTEHEGASRIAGISLLMHCKDYLKASSQKYCKQQATGSRLRSLSMFQLVKDATDFVAQVGFKGALADTPAHWRDGLQSIQNRLKVD